MAIKHSPPCIVKHKNHKIQGFGCCRSTSNRGEEPNSNLCPLTVKSLISLQDWQISTPSLCGLPAKSAGIALERRAANCANPSASSACQAPRVGQRELRARFVI